MRRGLFVGGALAHGDLVAGVPLRFHPERGNSARAISPVRSTCNTQRPSQRPPCRRERSKNAWRSSSVYCRRRAFLVLLWTVPPVISPCSTAGHRSEMWLGNRSARTRAPQFLHTERESSALSAAFSTMRRFRSLSRAFSRCSRAISVTISCVVTFAYSGTLLGPDQAGESSKRQKTRSHLKMRSGWDWLMK